MVFIWFNPDNNAYEKGTMRDYDRLILKSENNDRFGLLYEFNSTTVKLVDKILAALNSAHRKELEKLVA